MLTEEEVDEGISRAFAELDAFCTSLPESLWSTASEYAENSPFSTVDCICAFVESSYKQGFKFSLENARSLVDGIYFYNEGEGRSELLEEVGPVLAQIGADRKSA